MSCPRALIATLISGLLCVTAGAQAPPGSITGRVVDSTSQQPIVNVNVAVDGTSRGAITRSDGSFLLAAIPAGTYRVRATRIGYVSQTLVVAVSAGAPSTVQFRLAVAATTLTEMVVTGYGAQRREFDERQFELIEEGKRRQDMIRQGTYLIAGWNKPVSAPQFVLLPIPQPQMDANPMLVQNAGY